MPRKLSPDQKRVGRLLRMNDAALLALIDDARLAQTILRARKPATLQVRQARTVRAKADRGKPVTADTATYHDPLAATPTGPDPLNEPFQ